MIRLTVPKDLRVQDEARYRTRSVRYGLLYPAGAHAARQEVAVTRVVDPSQGSPLASAAVCLDAGIRSDDLVHPLVHSPSSGHKRMPMAGKAVVTDPRFRLA